MPRINIYQKFAPYLWLPVSRLRLQIVFSFIFVGCGVLTTIGIPLVFKNLIEHLSQTTNTSQAVFFILVGYAALWTMKNVFMQISKILLVRPTEYGTRVLSITLFKHLHSLPLSFHLDRKTGSITSIVNRMQRGFQRIFWAPFLFVAPLILELCVTFFILLKLYSWTYGFLFVVVLLFYAFSTIWSTNRVIVHQRQANTYDKQASAHIVDSLLNFETVKNFTSVSHEVSEAEKNLSLREKALVRFNFKLEFYLLLRGLIIGAGLLALTLMSGNEVLAGTMTLGDFVLINGYFLQLAHPLSIIGFFFREFREGLTDMEDAREILETPLGIEIKYNKLKSAPVFSESSITFENVSFKYQSSRPILNNVSFRVKPGEKVAIVGPTGAGKSTISRLITRFYDPTSGDIFIDGWNVKDVAPEAVRKLIGVVPQDTMLFNNTLRYNIAYGNPKCSEEELKSALKAANLENFVASLPEGLETVVGERGLKLSGGEKQRVSIARVFLKQPRIFLFDEATSALDTQTEKEIQNNLDNLSRNHTTLIIAHRLSTVVSADKIVVIDRGQIIGEGPHDTLLQTCKLYQNLWKRQHDLSEII